MENLQSPLQVRSVFDDFKNSFCDYANKHESDLRHLDLGLVAEIFCFVIWYQSQGGEL